MDWPANAEWTGRPRAHAGRHRCALPAGDLRALLKDVPLSMNRPPNSLRSSPRAKAPVAELSLSVVPANEPLLTEALAEISLVSQEPPAPETLMSRNAARSCAGARSDFTPNSSAGALGRRRESPLSSRPRRTIECSDGPRRGRIPEPTRVDSVRSPLLARSRSPNGGRWGRSPRPWDAAPCTIKVGLSFLLSVPAEPVAWFHASFPIRSSGATGEGCPGSP